MNDSVHPDGLAVTIFDRDLRLAVGPEEINFWDLRISESLKVSWWESGWAWASTRVSHRQADITPGRRRHLYPRHGDVRRLALYGAQ